MGENTEGYKRGEEERLQGEQPRSWTTGTDRSESSNDKESSVVRSRRRSPCLLHEGYRSALIGEIDPNYFPLLQFYESPMSQLTSMRDA